MRVEVDHEDKLESALGNGFIIIEERIRHEHLSYLSVEQGRGTSSKLSLNLEELREVYECIGMEINRISGNLPEDMPGEAEESWMDKLKT